MKHILHVLTAIAFAVTASAAEKIEGAFGLKLGDSFEPSGNRFRAGDIQAPRVFPLYDLADAYEFTPKIPNPAFSTYVVFLTPNSHRIYRILAISKPVKSETESEHSYTIRALLHRKYGVGPFEGPTTIEQQRRNVTVEDFADNPDIKFRVAYTDENLVIQASEERLDNKLKGANADGL